MNVTMLSFADTAYYDQQGYKCRLGLMVPPEPTTTTAVYTTPDMRGPPGPQGPKVRLYGS